MFSLRYEWKDKFYIVSERIWKFDQSGTAITVCGFSLHLGSSESCKTLEQKFIFQIGTLIPTEPKIERAKRGSYNNDRICWLAQTKIHGLWPFLWTHVALDTCFWDVNLSNKVSNVSNLCANRTHLKEGLDSTATTIRRDHYQWKMFE